MCASVFFFRVGWDRLKVGAWKRRIGQSESGWERDGWLTFTDLILFLLYRLLFSTVSHPVVFVWFLLHLWCWSHWFSPAVERQFPLSFLRNTFYYYGSWCRSNTAFHATFYSIVWSYSQLWQWVLLLRLNVFNYIFRSVGLNELPYHCSQM